MFDIKKYNKQKGCVVDCRKIQGNGKYECKNIICEIFYIVSVRMSGEILEYRKVGRYGPDGNQGHLFFLFSRNKTIKAIKC